VRFHALPFQCRTSGLARGLALNPVQPTTQALRPEAANTPSSVAPPESTGMRDRVHAEPFQCRIRGLKGGADGAVPAARARAVTADR
jgi:hypothetical protein